MEKLSYKATDSERIGVAWPYTSQRCMKKTHCSSLCSLPSNSLLGWDLKYGSSILYSTIQTVGRVSYFSVLLKILIHIGIFNGIYCFDPNCLNCRTVFHACYFNPFPVDKSHVYRRRRHMYGICLLSYEPPCHKKEFITDFGRHLAESTQGLLCPPPGPLLVLPV